MRLETKLFRGRGYRSGGGQGRWWWQRGDFAPFPLIEAKVQSLGWKGGAFWFCHWLYAVEDLEIAPLGTHKPCILWRAPPRVFNYSPIFAFSLPLLGVVQLANFQQFWRCQFLPALRPITACLWSGSSPSPVGFSEIWEAGQFFSFPMLLLRVCLHLCSEITNILESDLCLCVHFG